MDDSEGIATISKLTQEKFRYDCLQKPTADMIRISRWPTITRVFEGFRHDVLVIVYYGTEFCKISKDDLSYANNCCKSQR